MNFWIAVCGLVWIGLGFWLLTIDRLVPIIAGTAYVIIGVLFVLWGLSIPVEV